MKKLNTSPISGMLELLPSEQSAFNKMKNNIGEVFRKHGFLNIETPVIDRTGILLAKAGGETEKQIYKVIKTEETLDDADQALRFDHTVPLARYVVEHENDLTFPFKVFQVGRNYRGERAQKGRFREFYQLDIDVVGRNTLSVNYDSEVIATLFSALETLGLPKKLVRISNRKILSGFLEELNLNHLSAEIFSIIDHAEKVPESVTREKLEGLGLGEENVARVIAFIEISGSLEEALLKLNEFNFRSEKFNEGINELTLVFKRLEEKGLGDSIMADMKIVRGLDYYTGTVFETVLPDYKEIGSICSGGRYDNLAGFYTDQVLPGVGGSIGLTRLFSVLKEAKLLNAVVEKPVELALIPFSENEIEFVDKLAKELRAEGRIVDLVLTEKKLGDKFSYAGKIAKFAAVIGENETKTGEVFVKNLESGEQSSLDEFRKK
ncbi:histidine--tRNA ligase [Candidatus Saccharibacteria bacterium]|nr:histidine--tRNA ligase [Candidatus Saccharibacteria bacterium]